MTTYLGVIGHFVCEECRAPSKTSNGLPSITWRKIDGRWYCGTCAAPKSGKRPDGS